MAIVQNPVNSDSEYNIYLSNYMLHSLGYYAKKGLPSFGDKSTSQLACAALGIASAAKGDPPVPYQHFTVSLQNMAEDNAEYKAYLTSYIIHASGGHSEGNVPSFADKKTEQLAAAALGIHDAAKTLKPRDATNFRDALADRRPLKNS